MVPVAQLLLNLPGDWVSKSMRRREQAKKPEANFPPDFLAHKYKINALGERMADMLAHGCASSPEPIWALFKTAAAAPLSQTGLNFIRGKINSQRLMHRKRPSLSWLVINYSFEAYKR